MSGLHVFKDFLVWEFMGHSLIFKPAQPGNLHLFFHPNTVFIQILWENVRVLILEDVTDLTDFRNIKVRLTTEVSLWS